MRSFTVIVATAGLVFWLGITSAGAQGYEGLFAPDDGAPTAPAQPPGYQGLIPGAAPAAPAPTLLQPQTPSRPTTAAQPAKTVPRPIRLPPGMATTPAAPVLLTPAPGAPTVQPIRNSADLLQLARAHNLGADGGAISDEMAARARLPASSTELLKQPRTRINGMLPMESNIKNSIDATMASLRAPNLRPEDRAARVKMAVESLTTIKRGLGVKNGISDRTYQAMGLPPLYIKEEREALQKSLAHVDAALSQLQR